MLGDRLTVGRVALDHLIGVRIPVSQPNLRSHLLASEVTTPLEDAVASMRVFEALVQSGNNGAWV